MLRGTMGWNFPEQDYTGTCSNQGIEGGDDQYYGQKILFDESLPHRLSQARMRTILILRCKVDEVVSKVP